MLEIHARIIEFKGCGFVLSSDFCPGLVVEADSLEEVKREFIKSIIAKIMFDMGAIPSIKPNFMQNQVDERTLPHYMKVDYNHALA